MKVLSSPLASILVLFAGATCLEAAPPAAPSDFIFASSDGNDRATFTWTDNSDDETLFHFEIKIGDGAPFERNGPAADTETFTFTGFTPGTPVTFRLRSVKPLEGGGVDDVEFSEWTAPIEVVTKVLNLFNNRLSITMGDAFEYAIQKDFEGVAAITSGDPDWLDFDAAAGVFSAESGFADDATVGFEISQGIHSRSGSFVIQATSPPVVSSVVTGTPGEDFTYTLQALANFDQVTATGDLPSWLALDETNGVFTATNPPEGTVRVLFEVTAGGDTSNHFLDFNVINEGPTLLAAPSAMSLEGTGIVEVDLAPVFEDPDFIRAAAVVTPYGDITLGFYEGFPVTVANFFSYLESDAWDGAYFHRMAKLANGENFVLQGGGFKPGASEGEFARVTQLPAIVNEFDASRPNLNGTISMAKLGGNPNSATNQFFISLNDNRPILDGQNGGFTVFGRAANIAPVNEISTLTRGSFAVDVSGNVSSFDDWPVSETSAASPSFDQLITMQDVIEIPTLTYALTMTGDGIADAEIMPALGAPLNITPTGVFGKAVLTITASDLDGSSVSTTLAIDALATYERWATREMVARADENDDGDLLSNFEEYVYGTDPTLFDGAGVTPLAAAGDSGQGELTFLHRDDATDLLYSMQSSSDLVAWETVWTSADGFDDVQVTSLVDEGEMLRVTVRSAENEAPDERIFFRLKVEKTGDN